MFYHIQVYSKYISLKRKNDSISGRVDFDIFDLRVRCLESGWRDPRLAFENSSFLTIVSEALILFFSSETSLFCTSDSPRSFPGWSAGPAPPPPPPHHTRTGTPTGISSRRQQSTPGQCLTGHDQWCSGSSRRPSPAYVMIPSLGSVIRRSSISDKLVVVGKFCFLWLFFYHCQSWWSSWQLAYSHDQSPGLWLYHNAV